MSFLPFPATFVRNYRVTRRSRNYPIEVFNATHATSVCNAEVWFAVGDENVEVAPGAEGTTFIPANTFLTTSIRKQSLSPPIPNGETPPPVGVTHFAVVSPSFFPIRKTLSIRFLDQFAGDILT